MAAPQSTEHLEHAQYLATERVSLHLANAWRVEQHAVDFMVAAQPLAALARIDTDDEWRRLLQEMDGLVDGNLLAVAIDWLRFDAKQCF